MSDNNDDKNVVDIREAVAGAKLAELPVVPVAADDKNIPEELREGRHEKRDLSSEMENDEVLKSLPEDFPIKVLGRMGKISFYLDCKNQLIDLKPSEHNHQHLTYMVGEFQDSLDNEFPKWRIQTEEFVNKDGQDAVRKLVGQFERVPHAFDNVIATRCLNAATARAGIFDPQESLVGRGGSVDEDGALLYHVGNKILKYPVNGDKITTLWPGKISDKVYPGGANMLVPAEKVEDAGRHLMAILKSWNYFRAEDVWLVLGWIMVAPFSGALDWRPILWLTGDRGTGKSFAHQVVMRTIGNIVSVSDTTAAGVWQWLKHDLLPVAIDELEAKADNSKVQAVIKLARESASGSLMLRGGADHSGWSFKAKSCFLFSSILIPPLQGSDRSRIAVIDFKELSDDAIAPDINEKKMREIGQTLRFKFVRNWKLFKEILEVFELALMAIGHDNRGQDVFGHLMAGFWLAIHDVIPTIEEAAHHVKGLAPEMLSSSAVERSKGEECLDHLMGSRADMWSGGDAMLIGEIIQASCSTKSHDPKLDYKYYRKKLRSYGVGVVDDLSNPSVTGKYLLLVANHHPSLEKIFKDQDFGGGVWRQALMRLDGVTNYDNRGMNFGTPGKSKCIAVPSDVWLQREDGAESGDFTEMGV